ncbi:MAG: TolC family protein [Planctomycetota bacterium]|nr:TolC family protein [Planctomycetota bacterium]
MRPKQETMQYESPRGLCAALSLITLGAGAWTGCASTAPAEPAPPPLALASAEGHRAPGHGAPGAADESQELPADAELDQLIAHAIAANPGLRAARERWLAAREKAPQVATLPDPTLRLRTFVEEVETRVGPQELGLGLSQTLPWFGKLGLREEVASARAEAEGARYTAVVLAVIEEVQSAWYELYYLERSIATVRENRDLLRGLEEVLRTRYATGGTSYADLLRSQVELGRLGDRLSSLEDRRRPAHARLNAALHRSPDAPILAPVELAQVGLLRGPAELRDRMEESNPGLLALRHEQVAAERGVELADIARRPDVTVGIEYIGTGSAVNPATPGSGDDPLIASLSFTLPIYGNRYRAIEREARARQRGALAAIQAEVDRLHAALESEAFHARDAERQIGLYRDTLVPRARQSFAATETAFRASEAGFMDLVDAERVLLEFELALERARTDRALAVARLERLVGGSVTTEEGIAEEGEQR